MCNVCYIFISNVEITSNLFSQMYYIETGDYNYNMKEREKGWPNTANNSNGEVDFFFLNRPISSKCIKQACIDIEMKTVNFGGNITSACKKGEIKKFANNSFAAVRNKRL